MPDERTMSNVMRFMEAFSEGQRMLGGEVPNDEILEVYRRMIAAATGVVEGLQEAIVGLGEVRDQYQRRLGALQLWVHDLGGDYGVL